MPTGSRRSDAVPSRRPATAPSRRAALRLSGAAAAAGAGLALAGPATTAAAAAAKPASGHAPHPPTTPADALHRLRIGNARWVAGHPAHPDSSLDRRHHLAGGQNPFAVTFSCIDSRVPPELAFDQGLGDLFVIRTAAHTLDGLIEASLEYGPLELRTPLIAVVGHQKCGAVTAAVQAIEDGTEPPAHLPGIVEAVRPAYTRGRNRADTIDRTVRAYTRQTTRRLAHDPALARLIAKGDLAVRGAYYRLDDGAVHWL